ncbi:MAG: hypothetical protein IJ809_02375, partial [Clostridia bacterium]|nr:hypothetical protein [Clostridia bacterium]
MKRFIKRNYIFVFAAICISIVTFEIISGIINSGNKTERIIGVASTYSFWNMLSPSTETVDKIQNLKSILPIKYDYINDSEK